MSRRARLALLFALVLALLPLTVAAESAADATPDATPATTQDEAEPEVSTTELEGLLGTPAAQRVCSVNDGCTGCSSSFQQCACDCDQEAIACENACGEVPLCIFQCENDYQYCYDCCVIGGH
jgi:hypothetical protein